MKQNSGDSPRDRGKLGRSWGLVSIVSLTVFQTPPKVAINSFFPIASIYCDPTQPSIILVGSGGALRMKQTKNPAVVEFAFY
jgi:hypothetical protein